MILRVVLWLPAHLTTRIYLTELNYFILKPGATNNDGCYMILMIILLITIITIAAMGT